MLSFEFEVPGSDKPGWRLQPPSDPELFRKTRNLTTKHKLPWQAHSPEAAEPDPMPRRRRRTWFKQIALCLVMDVIATIAVAWGCAAFIQLIPYGQFPFKRIDFEQHRACWMIEVQSMRGAARVAADSYYGLPDFSKSPGIDLSDAFGGGAFPPNTTIPSWSNVKYEETLPLKDSRIFNWCIEDARGWLFVSMRSQSQLRIEPDQPPEYYSFRVESGIGLPVDIWDMPGMNSTLNIEFAPWYPRVLPVRPIWPNFVYCTLFYAAIAWFLFVGPGALLRWMRRRNNRCPRYGYDLRGNESSNCPECGDQRRADAPELC